MEEDRPLHQSFIPKCCRHPRSRLPTRPHPRPSSGPRLDQHCKDGQLSVSTVSPNECSPDSRNMDVNHEVAISYATTVCGGHYEYLKHIHVSSLDTRKYGNIKQNFGDCKSGDTSGSLPCTPVLYTSQSRENSFNCTDPGSGVWANVAKDEWWPVEVMEERELHSAMSDTPIGGQVSVQFYGAKQPCVVDPSTSLSPFDHCFEKRSCNPQKAFQNALKEALEQTEHVNLLDTRDDLMESTHETESTPDEWNGSSSSKTEDDDCDVGRGKRQRKRKLHFDELSYSTNMLKKVRRLKIMRYLGLTAPLGSPFSLTTHVGNSY